MPARRDGARRIDRFAREGEGREFQITAIIRSITALSAFFGGIAAAMVAALVLLVVEAAVMRYGLGLPVPWPGDLVPYLVLAMTFLGAPYALATRGHVVFDVLARNCGRLGAQILAGLAALVSIGFALGLGRIGIGLVNRAVGEGWRADDAAGLALWIPYLAIPLGAALLGLQGVAELVRAAAAPAPAPEAARFPD